MSSQSQIKAHERIWFAVQSGTIGKSDIPPSGPKFNEITYIYTYTYTYICIPGGPHRVAAAGAFFHVSSIKQAKQYGVSDDSLLLAVGFCAR